MELKKEKNISIENYLLYIHTAYYILYTYHIAINIHIYPFGDSSHNMLGVREWIFIVISIKHISDIGWPRKKISKMVHEYEGHICL